MKFTLKADCEFDAVDLDCALRLLGIHFNRISAGYECDAWFVGSIEVKPMEDIDVDNKIINDGELAMLMNALPGERVTEELISNRITHVSYVETPDGHPTLTICLIKVDNGYGVRGESACVDISNYNQAIGRKLAYEDAFRKLWPVFGFLLAEVRYRRMGGA